MSSHLLHCSGLALGGFFSLMSATFAYEDPLSRASNQLTTTRAQTMFVFKEMGRNMWSSGKGFAKVGMVYSGVECCIEGVSIVDPFLFLIMLMVNSTEQGTTSITVSRQDSLLEPS